MIANTNYYFWVRATNIDNTGSSASAWTSRLDKKTINALVTPTVLTASTNDSAKITLGWSNGSGDIYMLYWLSNATGWPAQTYTGFDFTDDVSPYEWTGMTRGTTYYFFVRSRNGVTPNFTYSPNWFPAQATGIIGRAPFYAPPIPTSPTTSSVSKTNITFGWTAGAVTTTTDATASYDYYTSTTNTAPTASTTPTGNIATTIQSFTYTASTSPSTQYFWVRSKNADLVSNWTSAVSATPIKLFTVTFSLNGGGGTAPSDASQTATSTTVSLPAVGSMTGPTGKPTFNGWVSTTGETTILTSPYTPTADVTLYAYWTAAATSYTVTYSGNGSTTGINPAPQSTTTSVTVATRPTYTRTNCSLGAGWNTASDGLGTNYADGSSLTPTANVTLYAKWTALTVTTTNPTVTFTGSTGTSPNIQRSWSWTTGSVTNGTATGYEWSISSTSATSGFGAFTFTTARTLTVNANTARWLKVRKTYTDGLGVAGASGTNAGV